MFAVACLTTVALTIEPMNPVKLQQVDERANSILRVLSVMVPYLMTKLGGCYILN